MREDPFKKLYDRCNTKDSIKKWRELPEFPTHMDIEITNHCNLKCVMCPTGMGYQKREQGFMTDDVYYRILDEIKEYKTPLRFIRWGEPTLHERWVEYIRDACGLGIMCHMNTNGILLSDEKIRRILDIGLDSIKISFQGINKKGYEQIRNKDYFETLREKIKKIHELRGKNKKPFLYVSTTVTDETENEIVKFQNLFEEYADKVSVWSTTLDHLEIERMKIQDVQKRKLQELKLKQRIKQFYVDCPEVFDKLSINWDGTVSACCRDYDNLMLVGDVREKTIREIWRSRRMEGYRKILADMNHDKLPLCRTCYSES